MKKYYTNAEIQIVSVAEQDVLTLSALTSNKDIAEDGNTFEELFHLI